MARRRTAVVRPLSCVLALDVRFGSKPEKLKSSTTLPLDLQEMG